MRARLRGSAVLAGCLHIATVSPSAAQHATEPLLLRAPVPHSAAPVGTGSTATARTALQERSLPRLVLGGAAGGAVGALSGGLLAVGARALLPCDDQDGCIGEYGDWAVAGAFIGASLALPVGVHLANDRRGRLHAALPASAGIGVAGLAAWWLIREYGTDDWGNTRGNPDLLTAIVVITTPALQLAVSTALERASARRRGAGTVRQR